MGGMDPQVCTSVVIASSHGFLTYHQDLFSQLFGGGGFFGGGGGGGGRQQIRRTRDLTHHIKVTLEDLYIGKTTKLALTRNVLCSKCGGLGGKEGAVRTCGTCKGRGVTVVVRQMGPMIQQMQMQCEDCGGTGEVINPKDRCINCKGKKVMPEKKLLEVHIDRGMRGGQTITFHGESDQSPNAESGDVVIILDEVPHERFKREGTNLRTEVELDLLTALGGGEAVIKHLDGRLLLLVFERGHVVPDGEAPSEVLCASCVLTFRIGYERVILGEGMFTQRHHDRGNLVVKFNVKFPLKIDPSKISYLEKALPKRPTLSASEKGRMEEVVLRDPEAYASARSMHDDAMDDDHDGEPRVQCANQ